MAYSYIVPQMRVFQAFAESGVTNTTSMRACIVAPKYVTLDGEGPGSYVSLYEGLSKTVDYQGLPVGGVVANPTTTVRTFLKNALVARSAPDFSSAAGNAATFAGAVTGDVASGDHAFKVGDLLVADDVDYTITGFGGVGNTVVYVNRAIADYPNSVTLYSFEDVEITESAGVVPGATSLTVPTGLVVGDDDAPVIAGDIYVSLVAFDASLSGIVGNISSLSDVEDILGSITPANPLAMMASIALQNSDGAGINYISLTEDSDAGYIAAFGLLDSDTVSYSIVPYSQTAAVRNALIAKLAELAGPTVMNWKIGWCGYDPGAIETVVSTDRDGDAISVELTDAATSLILDNVNLLLVDVGDTVTLTTGGVDTVTTVAEVSSTLNTIVVDDSVAIGEYTVVITRAATPISKAVEVAGVASAIDNYRIRLVVGDTPALTAFPGQSVSSAYLAAAAAGLRSGSAPHQPLTRVALNGITLTNASAFVGSHLDMMASGGAWVVARDAGTGLVYNRHQLTTRISDYKQREDSKITNADEICRYYREGLDDLYGRANISDELIENLYLRLDSIYQRLRGRAWSWLLGRQIVDVQETTVERDPDFSDRLLIRVVLTTPDPLNNLDIYLTIV